MLYNIIRRLSKFIKFNDFNKAFDFQKYWKYNSE